MSRFTYHVSKIVPGKKQRGYGQKPSAIGKEKDPLRPGPYFAHDWVRSSPGRWVCNRCGFPVEVLPNGDSKACDTLPEPCPPMIEVLLRPDIHPGPRGWWHATKGSYSEFFRTREEAQRCLSNVVCSGLHTQRTERPRAWTTCPVPPQTSSVVVQEPEPSPGKYSRTEILAKFTRRGLH